MDIIASLIQEDEKVIADCQLACSPLTGDILWFRDRWGNNFEYEVVQICHWIGGDFSHKLAIYVKPIVNQKILKQEQNNEK